MCLVQPANVQRDSAETPPEFSASAPEARVLEFRPRDDFPRPMGASPFVLEAAADVRMAAQLLELAYLPGTIDAREQITNDAIVRSAVNRLRCALVELVNPPAPPKPPKRDDPAAATRELSVHAFFSRADRRP